MKKNFLTQSARALFTLNSQEREVLVGLLLGDLNANKRAKNARLQFAQGILHKEYLEALYELFKDYCPAGPRVIAHLPDKKTGKVHSSIRLNTFSLPCFNEFYELFYISGKKVVPNTIGDLLTPLGLCYWICDDGSWNKVGRYLILCTNSFTLAEVELLIEVLNKKFNLGCYKCRDGTAYRIIIPAYSIPKLQVLLKDIMPGMMRHKIGL